MTSSAHGTPSNPSPHSNAQMMSRKAPPNHQPSPQKSLPSSQFAANSGQKRNAALWYDDNSGIVDPGSAVQGYNQHNRMYMLGGSHMTGRMTAGGGAVSGGGQGINHPVAGQVCIIRDIIVVNDCRPANYHALGVEVYAWQLTQASTHA